MPELKNNKSALPPSASINMGRGARFAADSNQDATIPLLPPAGPVTIGFSLMSLGAPPATPLHAPENTQALPILASLTAANLQENTASHLELLNQFEGMLNDDQKQTFEKLKSAIMVVQSANMNACLIQRTTNSMAIDFATSFNRLLQRSQQYLKADILRQAMSLAYDLMFIPAAIDLHQQLIQPLSEQLYQTFSTTIQNHLGEEMARLVRKINKKPSLKKITADIYERSCILISMTHSLAQQNQAQSELETLSQQQRDKEQQINDLHKIQEFNANENTLKYLPIFFALHGVVDENLKTLEAASTQFLPSYDLREFLGMPY